MTTRIFFVLLASTLAAQNIRSSLSGRITDPSGAVVASAQISIVNEIGRASCRERVLQVV